MDILLLRLLHIGAGAFWVGAVFTFFLFVQPAAVAVGPDAQKFTYQLLHHRRFPAVVLAAASVTVLAGILLLIITSNGLDPDRLFDSSRLGYTVGGVVAIVTFGIGALYVVPRTSTVERTIGRLLAESRPPTPDEQQLLGGIARESRRAGWVVLLGLVVATLAMATARYWSLFL
ncbi:MAG: hypothetical protein H0U86_03650 [Chloroflexi bacterium]|nr:hypothetical protein [Chloroflexota bacterium]